MNCRICGKQLIKKDDHAFYCASCNSLHNPFAKDIAYIHGGGQSTPNPGTQYWRLKNAKGRLALITPHASRHSRFIDIGCGSGEMLVTAKNCGMDVIGFDTNLLLAKYAKDTYGITINTDQFTPDQVPHLNNGSSIFSICHVLEHISEPILFLHNIYAAMDHGDLLYIEVPLFTGYSFQKKGYDWSLWYEEHLELFSNKTLLYIAEKSGINTLETGTRIFARGSHSTGLRLKLIRRHPIKSMLCLLKKNKALSLADSIMADYGWIILQK